MSAQIIEVAHMEEIGNIFVYTPKINEKTPVDHGLQIHTCT